MKAYQNSSNCVDVLYSPAVFFTYRNFFNLQFAKWHGFVIRHGNSLQYVMSFLLVAAGNVVTSTLG